MPYGFKIKIEQEAYTKSLPTLTGWFELWDYSHPSGCKKYMYISFQDKNKVEECLEFHIRAEQYLRGERKRYPNSDILIHS